MISENLKALYPQAKQVGEEDGTIPKELIAKHFNPELIRMQAERNHFLSSKNLASLQKTRYEGFRHYHDKV